VDIAEAPDKRQRRELQVPTGLHGTLLPSPAALIWQMRRGGLYPRERRQSEPLFLALTRRARRAAASPKGRGDRVNPSPPDEATD